MRSTKIAFVKIWKDVLLAENYIGKNVLINLLVVLICARNIVIVSATTLLATLRTVAYIWKQENQKRNVLEIARQAGAMYDKFVDFVSDLEKIGQKIDDANDSYHDAMNKLKDSKKRGDTLIGRAEKIKELGANTSKSLPPEI